MAIKIRYPSAGDLNRRVTIKTWTDAASTGFAIDQTFDAGINRWAKLEPMIGVANRDGQQVGEEITHRIWVRWGAGTRPEDLTVQHVVDYPNKNRRYRVVRAVNPKDTQLFTMIECKDIGAIV